MLYKIAWLVFCSLWSVQSHAVAFQALCYHDVRDDVTKNLDADSAAVSTQRLIAHFSWFKQHGFQPVSIQDLLDAREGKKNLPEKPLLLTFDDGYQSFYSRVFPLLKLFNYPAVLGLETAWLSAPPEAQIDYGTKETRPRDFFLDWGKIREMQASGWVELASHSHDLHHGELSNPQGNTQAAAISRRYDPKTQQYEGDAHYEQRVRNDLKTSMDIIEQHTGVRPRAMVWPYGAYNQKTIEMAKDLGMPITLSLDEGEFVGFSDSAHLDRVARLLIDANIETNDLNWRLRHWLVGDPQRVMQIDLDLLYNPDIKVQQKNLDVLIERVRAMRVSTLYLQAFSDVDGDGTAEALYFPNRHLPMRADLFNRVAWQLNTRAGAPKVYAWLPVMAFALPDKALNQALLVQTTQGAPAKQGYQRLSLFNPQARQIIGDIYEDLAKHAFFIGLFFQDDAYFSDFEDASATAMAYYSQHGLPASIERIRQNPALMQQWTTLKTQALVDFTDELVKRAKIYRSVLKTARNIYAQAVLNPDAKEWFAQDLATFLAHYDYAVVMAYTKMEGATDDIQWLQQILAQVKAQPEGLKRTVIKLQAKDWYNNQAIDAQTLLKQMQWLQRQGVLNFGYYPDNFIANQPDLRLLKQGISLENFPYAKP
jgi:biofilm PGA synthesis lipoprotein PgaB